MSDNESAKVRYQNGASENFIPTTHTYIDIDREKAINAKFLITKDKMNNIPSRINLELPGSLSRGALIQLDVIMNNLYDRPICFASSNPSVTGLGLRNYLQNEGMIIKFTPTGYPDPSGLEAMNSDDMYGQVMKYDFGKIKENDILLDEHTMISYINIKQAIANLALFYAVRNQVDTANKLLDHLYNNIPVSKMPPNYVDLPALQAAELVKNAKYIKLLSNSIFENSTSTMDWLTNPSNLKNVSPYQDEIRYNLSALSNLKDIVGRSGDSTLTNKINQKFKGYESALMVNLTQ